MNIQTLSGMSLGQYQLYELLGVGGMAAVYRAYQPALNRFVAVKVLSPALAQDPQYIERFNREARIAGALEHRYIVPIYDYGVQDGFSYVVMRLLPGGTLAQRTRQSVLPLDQVVTLLDQLAGALDFAHSKGIIHRDLKPSNIMFDEQGNAYITDLGIAKLAEGTTSFTSTGQVMGTPLYMSPEQWRAEPLTPAADQYALAVMTYGLVAGHLPFEAPTPHALMYRHLNELPPRVDRPGVPEAVSQVLARAMAKRPQDRFPSVSHFAQAFAAAARNRPGDTTNIYAPPPPWIAPPPPTTVPYPMPQPRSNRGLWIALAVVLLLIAGGVALVLLLSLGGDDEHQTTALLDTTEPPETESTAEIDVITETPKPGIITETPNLDLTVNALMTQTANAWTDTPTPTASFTPTFTPSPTPTPTTPAPAVVMNRQIAYTSNQALYLWDSSTNAVQLLTNSGESYEPDIYGNLVVFASARNGSRLDIYLYDLNSGTQRQITTDGAQDRHPSFSPDGRQIAFTSDRTGNWDIYIVNVDGSGEYQLTNTSYNEYAPSWSPDGRRLAYQANGVGKYEIYVHDLASGAANPLTNTPVDVVGALWSPGGEWIACYTNVDPPDVVTVNATTGEWHEWPRGIPGDWWDADTILFHRIVNDNTYVLFTLDVLTRQETELLQNGSWGAAYP